jgi:hypothetical protein
MLLAILITSIATCLFNLTFLIVGTVMSYKEEKAEKIKSSSEIPQL